MQPGHADESTCLMRWRCLFSLIQPVLSWSISEVHNELQPLLGGCCFVDSVSFEISWGCLPTP